MNISLRSLCDMIIYLKSVSVLPVWNILNVNYDYDPTVFVNYTRERLDTVIVSSITVMGLNLINNHCILIHVRNPGTTNPKTVTDDLGAGRSRSITP